MDDVFSSPEKSSGRLGELVHSCFSRRYESYEGDADTVAEEARNACVVLAQAISGLEHRVDQLITQLSDRERAEALEARVRYLENKIGGLNDY
jgi:hypothetical protein